MDTLAVSQNQPTVTLAMGSGSLASGGGGGGSQQQQDYETIRWQHDALRDRYDDLQVKFNELQERCRNDYEGYERMQREHSKLNEKVIALNGLLKKQIHQNEQYRNELALLRQSNRQNIFDNSSSNFTDYYENTNDDDNDLDLDDIPKLETFIQPSETSMPTASGGIFDPDDQDVTMEFISNPFDDQPHHHQSVGGVGAVGGLSGSGLSSLSGLIGGDGEGGSEEGEMMMVESLDDSSPFADSSFGDSFSPRFNDESQLLDKYLPSEITSYDFGGGTSSEDLLWPELQRGVNKSRDVGSEPAARPVRNSRYSTGRLTNRYGRRKSGSTVSYKKVQEKDIRQAAVAEQRARQKPKSNRLAKYSKQLRPVGRQPQHAVTQQSESKNDVILSTEVLDSPTKAIKLEEHVINVHMKSPSGKALLIRALLEDDMDKFKMLCSLQNCKTDEIPNDIFFTNSSLAHIVSRGVKNMSSKELSKAVDVGSQLPPEHRQTSNDVIAYLAQMNRYGAVQVALDFYPEHNLGNALFVAVYLDHYPMVEMLLKRNANPNICTAQGWNPLHVAVLGNQMKMTELLMTRTQIDAENRDGLNILDIAQDRENEEIIQLILNCDEQKTLRYSIQALIRAIKSNNVLQTQMLLNYGIDTTMEYQDQTVLEYGWEQKSEAPEVWEVLCSHCEVPDFENDSDEDEEEDEGRTEIREEGDDRLGIGVRVGGGMYVEGEQKEGEEEEEDEDMEKAGRLLEKMMLDDPQGFNQKILAFMKAHSKPQKPVRKRAPYKQTMHGNEIYNWSGSGIGDLRGAQFNNYLK